MIHDAKVLVTCDGTGCIECVEIFPDFRSCIGPSGSGYYDTTDAAIERKLTDEEDWRVVNGKHFCCDDCVIA